MYYGYKTHSIVEKNLGLDVHTTPTNETNTKNLEVVPVKI